jgi:hypothetical protein
MIYYIYLWFKVTVLGANATTLELITGLIYTAHTHYGEADATWTYIVYNGVKSNINLISFWSATHFYR